MSADCAKCRARTKARETRYVETPEMATAAQRFVRALGRRAADDVTGLPMLAELRALVDEQLHAAVAGAIVDHGWTWQQVADELRVTRQSAHRRFSPAANALDALRAAEAPESAGDDAAPV